MNPITFSERLNICLESDAAMAATEAELSIAEYMAEMGEADEATMEAIFNTRKKKKQSWWQTIKDKVSVFVQAVIDFCRKVLRSIKLFFVKEDIKRTSSTIDKVTDFAKTKGVTAAKKTAKVVAPIAVSSVLLTFVSKKPFKPKEIIDAGVNIFIGTLPGGKEILKYKNMAKELNAEANAAVDAAKGTKVATEALGSKDIYKEMSPDEVRKWLKTGSDYLMSEAVALSSTLKTTEGKLDLMKDTQTGAEARRALVDAYDICISMIRDRLRVLKATVNHMK